MRQRNQEMGRDDPVLQKVAGASAGQADQKEGGVECAVLSSVQGRCA